MAGEDHVTMFIEKKFEFVEASLVPVPSDSLCRIRRTWWQRMVCRMQYALKGRML